MINAVIYARYSSHNQREESIEGQLRECHDFAEKNGLTVVKEYCDRAISGKTDQRPSFQKLIRDSEKGHFQAVIMYTLDRFARNRYDSAIYKAKLKKNGVRVFYAKQPMPEGPEAIILESVMEGYAEYYSENLSRNIKRGMRDNALKGLTVGGNSTPLGYTVVDKRFVIDPVGAKIVKEIYEMYASGVSAAQIITYCNEQGYKTSSGSMFNKNSLRTILQNEKYIGVYKFMDIVIPYGVPAIIDKELFDKVQNMRTKNAKTKARTKAHEEYLLTTKLFCGHCGSAMVGDSGTAKSGKMHYYYKCIDRKRKHNCTKKTERKEWIEDVVTRYTVEHVLTDENIDLLATRTMELIEKEAADSTYLNALQEELKETNKKLRNLISAMEQGIVTASTKERLEELESEKKRVEGQIAREEIKKPSLTKERIVFWLRSFKDGDLNNIEYKRKIIDTFVNSVYVYDEGDKGRKIVLTFNISRDKTVTLSYSDIESSAPPKGAYPNTLFFVKHCFGYVVHIEEVG